MKFENSILTKTKYVHGLECQRLLWYECNSPSVVPEEDEAIQERFEQGKEVEELAKTLYSGGISVDLDKLGWNKAMELSKKVLEDRKPIFEAGFQYKELFARADILNPVSRNQWDLIEVKSSTSVKEEHLNDLSFQKYVYDSAGIKIRNCYLMHLNKEYVRQGEIDIQELFETEDITEKVDEFLTETKENIQEMISIIRMKKCPELEDCTHCGDPDPCPIPDICWSFLPKRNIFFLYNDRGKKNINALWEKGILELEDIPDNFSLNEKQRIQVNTEKTGIPFVNVGKMSDFLKELKYPLYFLDFETFSIAIPQHDNSKPYENIPFQYSLHIVSKPDRKIQHFEYLVEDQKDPRLELLNRLEKELGTEGTILVYNETFEKGVLQKYAERFPKYKKWVDKILPRIVDLYKPFKSFYYYHPHQDGSASLKSVLPVLTGRKYEDMEIQEGGQASQEFLRVTYTDVSQKERMRVRKALKEYCKLDTEGMIDIIKALETLLKKMPRI